MTSKKVVELSLSSGNAIPLLGYGTAAHPFDPLKTKQSVLKAIELGYRQFDTASAYQSEKPLGEAVREALKLGLIKSREELFVTSKLWCSDAHHNRVLPALQNTLRNLGLEYLDLYLIHWPVSVQTAGSYDFYMGKEELMPMDFSAVWKAMEECKKLGLTKSIGVSNFSCKKLQIILDVATIPPAVNQVEMSPCWQQKKLREFCKEKGIHVAAFSPLGAKGTPWGTDRVLDSDILQSIAQAKGKTVAQICLRWAYEQGVIVIVKSFDEIRMKENLDIYDWELSDEDYRQIEQISQEKCLTYLHITGGDTPFKTLDDLWDGEF